MKKNSLSLDLKYHYNNSENAHNLCAKENYLKVIQSYHVIDLNNSYFLIKDLLIGKGKYGQVFFGVNKKDFTGVAIKRQGKNTTNDSLVNKEYFIFKELEKSNIFPKLYEYINFGYYYYFIESLQGPDLSKFFRFSNEISLETAYKLGIEIIINLQILHNLGYLHIDIKEDNIASLTEAKVINSKVIHFALIDFGFVVRFKNEDNYHYEPSGRLKKCGNYFYASQNSLPDGPVSRKDDLLSVIYLLFNWCCDCPWKNIYYENPEKLRKEILEIKKNVDMKKICGKNCKEIYQLYELINNLGFKDEPNYEKYIEILSKRINNNNIQEKIDGFCWDKKLKQKLNNAFSEKKNILEDSEIQKLFIGFPKEFIENFINKNYMK